MKRFALIAALAGLTGCSNAPVAGFLDNCFPSRAKADSPPPGPAPRVDPVRPGVGPAPAPAPGPRPGGSDAPLPPPDFGPVGPPAAGN